MNEEHPELQQLRRTREEAQAGLAFAYILYALVLFGTIGGGLMLLALFAILIIHFPRIGWEVAIGTLVLVWTVVFVFRGWPYFGSLTARSAAKLREIDAKIARLENDLEESSPQE